MPAALTKLTPKGWATVGGAAAVAIVFLMLVFQMASAPSYTTLEAGLDPATTGKVTSALAGKGIAYQLQNSGTAVAVDPSQVAQARVALASAGLLGTGSSTVNPLNLSMGATTYQQQLANQMYLEQQLDQTIAQIQGVSGAQVHLVLPDPTQAVFGNASPSTASVLISDTGAMDPGAVHGIAELVASSVPGLALDKVTVTDTTGQLLWPTADSSGAAGAGTSSKQAAEARYDASMASTVNAMLTQALGPGKAMVQVNADLNENQTQQQSLTYANKGVPLTSQTQTETLTGNGTNGTAGAAGNIPGYAALAGGKSNYKNTTTNVQNAVSKTVTQSTIAPGAINSQSVSVMVDKTVPPAELANIQKAVSEAVGLNTKRGDSIVVVPMSFAKQSLSSASAAAGGAAGSMMNYAKYAIVGLGSLIFLFFVGRAVRKREREALVAEPTWLRELEAPRTLASLQGPRVEMAQLPHEPPTQVIPLQAPVNVARRQVEDLVERDADRVAQQVRAWMAED